jgi:hypothetical protein
LTSGVGGRILRVIAETTSRRVDVVDLSGRFGSAMSSEHAIEQVPLSEIREGDMLQDPRSGRWIKVTQTADSKIPGADKCSGGETPVTEEYRVYYGDGGEAIDSRLVTGLVNRQIRE